MSDTLESLKRKISGAADLESVVRTMKVLAASNIIQYEKAVISLAEYYKTVEMGLFVCFQRGGELHFTEKSRPPNNPTTGAIIFGSDQGLVGQFNDVLAEFATAYLEKKEYKRNLIWAVGERMQSRLEDYNAKIAGVFAVPGSVNTITSIIGKLLLESEIHEETGGISKLYIFHNQLKSGALYEPAVQCLLPLDEKWYNSINQMKWPTYNPPEAINGIVPNLHGLIRQYLFISLYRACAESLASENASRLAAMQRAEKNIDELLEDLNRTFHRLRQATIDEELFDVISGSESFSQGK